MEHVAAQLIHDMRNTAIVLREAASQLQQGGATLPPAAVDHLCAMMARRSEMLVRLLDDLGTSDLADRGSLAISRQRVSLTETCGEVLDGHPLPPGVAVTVDVPTDAMVLADPLRITQVVDNLVSNAMRYGGPDIRVVAAAAAAEEDSVVRLSVTDDGPGVPDRLAGSLFEGYSRGDSSRGFGGSGLGLSIVRQLAEAMGGSVSHDHHSGTRFTVTLPALPATGHQLQPDQADHGHCVSFWTDDHTQSDPVLEGLASYAAHGLTRGEAVLVAATPARLDGVAGALSALGLDLAAATASGQYVALDAETLHHELADNGHIDLVRFQRLIGDRVRSVSAHWSSLRVYGEIVDLYWRRGDAHLALERESCWNALRQEVPFPLLCVYELAPGRTEEALRRCHDAVVVAA